MKNIFKITLFILISTCLVVCSRIDEKSGYKIEKYKGKKYLIAEDVKNVQYNNMEILKLDNVKNENIILKDGTSLSLPEKERLELNYDNFISFLNKYELESKFNDKNKKYIVITTNSVYDRNITKIVEDNEKTYIYFHTEYCDTWDLPIKFIIIQINDKPIEYQYVYTEKEFYELSHQEIVYSKKPVVYIYNEDGPIDVNISIKNKNKDNLDIEYPKSDNGVWKIIANSNGTIDYNSREYNYLFYEDSENINYNLDEGFCVAGKDTEQFLEFTLTRFGLSQKEQDDFITYWLPEMVNNKYNIIKFNPEEFFDVYKISSTPQADNMMRIFMVFKPSDEFVRIKEQNIEKIANKNRYGLTIVEWGGSKI